MVQGSYPDDEETEGRVGGMGASTNGEVEEEAEESAGERGESSDDVEERDCFGGVDSCDRLEEFGRFVLPKRNYQMPDYQLQVFLSQSDVCDAFGIAISCNSNKDSNKCN